MAPLLETIPERVLAIYAHPDDPDVGCGGTLARFAQAGSDVQVVLCTNGDKGTRDPGVDPVELAQRRAGECDEAAKLLGLTEQHILGYGDGELTDDEAFRGELVGWIRRLRPTMVLCPDPTAVFFGEDYFNHRDHRIVGFAVLDALSPAAALPLYFPDAGPVHQVETALLSGTLEPTVWVDVSATIDDKAAAVSCHKSQFAGDGEWAASAVRARAAEDGRRAGVAFAEGFPAVAAQRLTPVTAPKEPEVVVGDVDSCTVMHVDLDAFFAAVEVLDDPSLAGKPVIVGGSGTRGVVAACTYEARAYGIHSAMSSVEARRRCPHAIFLAGRFSRYSEMSVRFHEVLHHFTPLVEGIALDEAFLDVAGARRILGSPPTMARAIREAVRDALELNCAVGVARTKLLAKLASRAAKPIASRAGTRPGPGVVVVAPGTELAFLHPLPVRALWGVGPATGKRLSDLGVVTIGDLAAIPVDTLCRVVGVAAGHHLAALSRGDDDRPVVAEQDVKSVGHEETFAGDLHDHAASHGHVIRMSDAVGRRLQEADLRGRTITVKIRFGDHATITRSHTVSSAIDSPRAIGAVAGALLDAVDISSGIRLLGVSLSGLVHGGAEVHQLSFADTMGDEIDEPAPEPGAEGPEGQAQGWEEVEAAVMAVRTRYGHGSVGPATLIGGTGLGVKRRGDMQWGPSAPAEASSDDAGDGRRHGKDT